MFEGFEIKNEYPQCKLNGNDAMIVLERYFERERKLCEDNEYCSKMCASNIEFIRKQIDKFTPDYTLTVGMF